MLQRVSFLAGILPQEKQLPAEKQFEDAEPPAEAQEKQPDETTPSQTSPSPLAGGGISRHSVNLSLA